MARHGVSYLEVAEAISFLIGQGKNPTIEQIRLVLGTGSSTTIANHLKQWKEKQKANSLGLAKESIPQELQAMLKGLWDRVIDHSEEKITAVESESERTIHELQLELQKYKNNNRRWQQLFIQWVHTKEELEKQIEGLKAEIKVLSEYDRVEQNELVLA